MINLKLGEAEQLLCVVVSDAPLERKGQAVLRLQELIGDQPLYELAVENEVTPHVAHVLAQLLEPGSVRPHWSETHRATHDRISGLMRELDRVGTALAKEGIPMVALKNAGIARGIFDCPGCCPMGDLDVLVSKRDFRKAHRILLSLGYHFEFRSELEEAELEAAEKGGGAEYWTVLPNGEKLWFELQWRPVAGRWIREDQEPSGDDLLDRSATVEHSSVRLLSPEDNLLQVALHTAKHSYVRAPGFRLHTDVDRIVSRVQLDWDLFVSRVSALEVKTAVYFSLAIPASYMGTHIPEGVLHQLRPPRWKAGLLTSFIRRAGLLNPTGRKFGKVSYILFNALLYDDMTGLWKALCPDRKWMMKRYGFKSPLLLPIYHMRRWANLLVKRTI